VIVLLGIQTLLDKASVCLDENNLNFFSGTTRKGKFCEIQNY
jgi:hypothetical protein